MSKARGRLWASPGFLITFVNIAAVVRINHIYHKFSIVCGVYDPVIPNSETEQILSASQRTAISLVWQPVNGRKNAALLILRLLFSAFLEMSIL